MLKRRVLSRRKWRGSESVTCTVNGLVSLEWTFTQGSYPRHGATYNNFHRLHKALGVSKQREREGLAARLLVLQTVPPRPEAAPSHLHPQISLLSSSNLQATDLCWRDWGQGWKASMLVAEFTVHIELQARAGSRRSSESQESRVCPSISQACLL